MAVLISFSIAIVPRGSSSGNRCAEVWVMLETGTAGHCGVKCEWSPNGVLIRQTLALRTISCLSHKPEGLQPAVSGCLLKWEEVESFLEFAQGVVGLHLAPA